MARFGAVVRRSAIAIATSAALVLGVGVTAEAQDLSVPAEVVPEVPKTTGLTAVDVPPLVSEPLDEPLAAPRVADVELAADAPLDSSVTDVPKSLPDRSTNETSYNAFTSVLTSRGEKFNTYRNADGSDTMVLSPTPVNVRKAGGDWVPIATDVAVGKDGLAEVADHPLSPRFGKSAGEGAVLAVSSGNSSLSLSLEGASGETLKSVPSAKFAESDAEVDAVSYAEVFPGVDLQLEVEKDAIQQLLVLEDAPVEAPVYRWHVAATGVELLQAKTGEYTFVNPEGDVVFTMDLPGMWDSSGIAGVRDDASAMVDMTVEAEDGGWVFELRPSMEWLTDPIRVYPISVDPRLGMGSTAIYGYKSDGYQLNGWVRVGNTRQNNTNVYWRSVVRYDYSPLAGKQIIGGLIHGVYDNAGYFGAATGAVHDAACNGYSCAGVQLSTWTISSEGFAQDGGIAQYYSNMVNANFFDYHVLERGEEGSTYTHKDLRTALYLDYKAYPYIQTYVSPPIPANGGTNQSLKPIMKADAVLEPGTTAAFRYLFWTNSTQTGDPVYASPWGGSTQQIPQGALLPGTTYYWAGEVYDNWHGYLGTSTIRRAAQWSFTTNTPAPTPARATATPADGMVTPDLTPTFTSTTVADPNSSAG